MGRARTSNWEGQCKIFPVWEIPPRFNENFRRRVSGRRAENTGGSWHEKRGWCGCNRAAQPRVAVPRKRGFPGWIGLSPGSQDWVVKDGHAFGFGQDAAGDHEADEADDGGPFGAAECAVGWRLRAHQFREGGGFAGDFAEPFG